MNIYKTLGLLHAVPTFAVAILAACSGPTTGTGIGSPQLDPNIPRVAPPQTEHQSCDEDLDCVLVQDCCGCGAGGRLLAVNSESAEELEAAADAQCSSQCSGAQSSHRSCTSTEAICRGGRCIPAL